MFIVFEGLDGSGKSTLIQAFGRYLDEKQQAYIVTREPGATELGTEIRRLLLKTEGEAPVSRAELLLYEADRAQHVEKKILPARLEGKWVLCDRYAASTLAFQCGGRGLKESEVEGLNEYATQGLQPELYVLIDLPVEVSRQRQQNREEELGQKADRFESEKDAFHERVRQHYLKLAQRDPQRWLVLDGRLSPQDLFEKLKSAVKL